MIDLSCLGGNKNILNMPEYSFLKENQNLDKLEG